MKALRSVFDWCLGALCDNEKVKVGAGRPPQEENLLRT